MLESGGNKVDKPLNLSDLADGASALCHDNLLNIRVPDVALPGTIYTSGGERKPRPTICLSMVGL